MRRAAVVIGLVVCIAAGGSAWAAIGYGPTVMEDPTVLDVGAMEFRTVVEYQDLAAPAEGEEGLSSRASIALGIDYGATDRLEVGLALPFVRLDNGTNETGLGDLVLSGKIFVLDEDNKRISLAVGVDVKVDTGSDEIVGADNDTETTVKVLMSKTLAVWNLFVNLGYLNESGDDGQDVISYGLGVEVPGDNMDLTLELVGNDKTINDDEPSEIYVGFRKTTAETEDFAISVGSGLSDASPDLTVLLVYRYGF